MFSYEFYMDGSIQVSVRAAGYIQSAYYAKNEDYGYQIHDALSGTQGPRVAPGDPLSTQDPALASSPSHANTDTSM